MPYTHDLVVYIGRFQPKHKAHHANTLQALTHGRYVLVLIGSAHEHPRVDNPFSYAERVEQFRVGFTAEQLARLIFLPLEDWLYVYPRWLSQAKKHAHNVCLDRGLDPARIALIGYDKDNTSYYVHDFPEWDFLHVAGVPNMSSTDIREWWYRRGDFGVHPSLLPASNTYWQAQQDRYKDRFVRLRMLYERYRVNPYGPISMATDAVVFTSIRERRYILVVRRSDDATLALPGGYLDRHETLEAGARRELREETGLDLTDTPLAHRSQVFDDPKRSGKGRVLTQAHIWEIESPAGELPTVQGGDDATEALWLPVDSLVRAEFHDDHYQIIHYLLETYYA